MSSDPLRFPSYAGSLARATASGADESLSAGPATIAGHAIELAAFEFSFIGGSVGEVAGERLARALERAAARRVPLVMCTATGGARLQEGMRALAQMAKLASARLELADARQPLIAVFENPTMGGVLASVGAIADVTLAEERATVGFAGPRLVQLFTRRPLVPGSHTAESALAHGLVDATVPRHALREKVACVLDVLHPDAAIADARAPGGAEPDGEPEPWSAVEAVRAPGRLRGEAVLAAVAEQLFELRGDRAGQDDTGIRAALARVAGRRSLLLALDRATPPGPGAFRKALRCLEIAARLDLPVVTLIDTPGADVSETSERTGLAWALGELIEGMLSVPVPTLAVLLGEGGSGAALALAVADAFVASSDATFSVIAPEAAAEILWRDPRRAPEAARALKLTAPHLLRLGIADALFRGPPTHDLLPAVVAHHLGRVVASAASPAERVARRRARWRQRV